MSPTVGVIGGGQLARMMIPPAVELGLGIRVLAENAGESAGIAVTQLGDYRRFSCVFGEHPDAQPQLDSRGHHHARKLSAADHAYRQGHAILLSYTAPTTPILSHPGERQCAC